MKFATINMSKKSSHILQKYTMISNSQTHSKTFENEPIGKSFLIMSGHKCQTFHQGKK